MPRSSKFQQTKILEFTSDLRYEPPLRQKGRMMLVRFSIVGIISLVLFACGEAKESSPLEVEVGGVNRLERMSLEQRESLAPNELFQAIYEEDLSKVQAVVEESPHLLESQNAEHGELPLATALRLRLKDIALFLTDASPLKLFSTPNQNHESIFFLASKYGMPDVITRIGVRHFENHTIQLVYNVDALDFADSYGRKALHVAANRRVVEALHQEHQRGYLKIPYFGLFLHQDFESQNFLHAAARDGRSDVLLWGTENFCGEEWKDSENVGVSIVGHLTLWPLRAFQSYFPWSTPIDHPINHQDLHYKTPLHYAAEYQQLDSMLALGSCQWTDYDLADEDQNLAFHLYVKSLDPQQRTLSSKEKEALRLFIHRQTLMRKIFVSTDRYINAANKNGVTPMHLAAQLADPWAYNELRTFGGDIFKRNNEGLRPVDLFEQKQLQVRESIR